MKRTGVWLFAAMTVLVLLAGGGYLAMNRAGEFDRAAWQAGREAEGRENPRRAMLDEARAMLTPGMPRAEVEARLGPPDREINGQWVYGLGAAFPSPDFEELVIEFDTEGGLSRHFIRQL